MAELQRYRSFVLTYNSTSQTFEVGANALVYVFSEGASVNQAGTLSGSAGTALTVFSTGSFQANDYVQIGVGGTVRQVTAIPDTTHLTLGSGTAQTVAVGDRALNVGTSANRLSSRATIYAVDQSTATAITNSKVTCDANGNYVWFATTGDYDCLIQDSLGTDLYIDENITIFAINRTGSVTYLTSNTDDFAVGGSTPTVSALYVDSSALITYIGGDTKNNIILDGVGGNITLGKTVGDPSLIFDNSTNFTTTLTSSTATSNKTITLPNLTGTILVGASQTIAGTQTFSGAIIGQSTLAITGTSTLTGAVTMAGGYTVSSGNSNNKRVRAAEGTTVSSISNTVLTGWGSGATIGSITTGSKDQRIEFTVTTGTTASANPTIALPINADGAWTSAPFAMVARRGGTAASPSGSGANELSWTTSTTTCTITYNGTPANSSTLPLTVILLG